MIKMKNKKEISHKIFDQKKKVKNVISNIINDDNDAFENNKMNEK